MKRFISFFVSAIMLTVTFAHPVSYGALSDGENRAFILEGEALYSAVKVYSEDFLTGDVNNDGEVGSKDSRSLKMSIAGLDSDCFRYTSDINGDGSIGSTDSRALKKMLVGSEEQSYITNSGLVKKYDESSDGVKLCTVSHGSLPMFFEFSPDKDLLSAGCDKIAVVVKDAEISSAGIFNCETVMPETVFISSRTGSRENCTAYISETDGIYLARDYTVEYIIGNCKDTLVIDSVILASDDNSLSEAVAERLRRTETDAKYTEVAFDGENALKRVSVSKQTSVSYSSEYNAMKLQTSGKSTDPWALISFDDLDLEADDYNYVVYTSMVLDECSQSEPQGQLFFITESMWEVSNDRSIRFSEFADGAFTSVIIDLSMADFRNDKLNDIRFDYFNTAQPGDVSYVKSIAFCSSFETALSLAENRTPSTDHRRMFFYGRYDDGVTSMPYRLYIPFDYDPSKTYPMMLMLHGAGQRGSDGISHVAGGFPYMFTDLSSPLFETIVLAPQCPESYRWVETNWASGSYSLGRVGQSVPLTCTLNIMNNIFSTYSVNRDSVVVTGLSMGGFGTWYLLMTHPDIFAAGVPLCGGGDPSMADVLKDIPIKAFHGTKDTTVPFRASQEMYDSIIAAGGTKIEFTPYVGYEHDIWTDVYQRTDIFEWLISQKLSDRK